jgi:hypothetical protein
MIFLQFPYSEFMDFRHFVTVFTSCMRCVQRLWKGINYACDIS